eukprot:3155297-Amphidinium_carterae.1
MSSKTLQQEPALTPGGTTETSAGPFVREGAIDGTHVLPRQLLPRHLPPVQVIVHLVCSCTHHATKARMT